MLRLVTVALGAALSLEAVLQVAAHAGGLIQTIIQTQLNTHIQVITVLLAIQIQDTVFLDVVQTLEAAQHLH
jgi:malonyl CoA-acyl carrier protein transacylase